MQRKSYRTFLVINHDGACSENAYNEIFSLLPRQLWTPTLQQPIHKSTCNRYICFFKPFDKTITNKLVSSPVSYSLSNALASAFN